MIITEILPVTKQKSRIVTDEKLAFVLYKGELSRYKLAVGKELSQEVFTRIQQEVLVKRAKLRAMHLLTRMDYTEAELYRKLMKGEYTKEAVDIAMEYVRSYHYLDDQRYASQYVAGRAGTKSMRQMEFELKKKGVSREIIAACREGLEEQDETPLIRQLLEKRCRQPEKADAKEKNRHYAYLVRKGFRMEDISRVFEEYFCDRTDFERFS